MKLRLVGPGSAEVGTPALCWERAVESVRLLDDFESERVDASERRLPLVDSGDSGQKSEAAHGAVEAAEASDDVLTEPKA